MKVTLVRPPIFIDMESHPLNLGYIYASLANEDFIHLDFIDGERFGLKYFKERQAIYKNKDHQMWIDISRNILQTNPDIVAFSCISVSMTGTKYIIDHLRNYNYKNNIWLGGVHPTTCCSKVFQNIEGINGIVIGEGEATFKEVCRAIHFQEDLSHIKGIAYKRDNQIFVNESRPLLENLDELPLPSRTFMGRNRYKNHIVLTSRGCPFNCDFCDSKNMWTRRVRYHSSEHIAREVKTVAEVGIKDISIGDDTFTLNKEHVENICKSLKNYNLDRLRYNLGSRIDTMDDDMICILKNLNMDYITFGVESGSLIVQERMKKNLDISKVLPVIEKTNKAGIRTYTFFMVGHPGETQKDIEDTFSLIRDLTKYCKKNIISINTTCPYPGTGYWEYAVKKHGNFIDFYKDSYKYYHQGTPFINITDMDDKLFHEYVAKINHFAKNANLRARFHIALGNPKLFFAKIKKRFCF